MSRVTRQRTQRALETLSTFRTAWALQLGGHSHDAIAQHLHITVPEVRNILKEAPDVLTYARGVDYDINELRRIEAARLDELQRAHWPMATGQFVQDYLDGLPDRVEGTAGDEDEAAANRMLLRHEIEDLLPRLVLESQRSAKLVLDIHKLRRELFGLIETESDGDAMPTVIFVAQRPERSGRIPNAIDVPSTVHELPVGDPA